MQQQQPPVGPPGPQHHPGYPQMQAPQIPQQPQSRPPFQQNSGFARPPFPGQSPQLNPQRPPFNPQQPHIPPGVSGTPRPSFSPALNSMPLNRPLQNPMGAAPPAPNTPRIPPAGMSPMSRPPPLGQNQQFQQPPPQNMKPPSVTPSPSMPYGQLQNTAPQSIQNGPHAASNIPVGQNLNQFPQQPPAYSSLPPYPAAVSHPPPTGNVPPPTQIGSGIDALNAQMGAMNIQKTSPRTKRVYHNPALQQQPAGNVPPPAFSQPPPFPGPAGPNQTFPGPQAFSGPPPPTQQMQGLQQPFPGPQSLSGPPVDHARPPFAGQPSQNSFQNSSAFPSRDSSHSNLMSTPAQRSRIDPDQIPSPIVVHDADKQLHATTPYMTTSKGLPPLASTDFVAIDDGNCNPRFARMTTYNIPANEELANTSQVPMGLLMQPLADLGYGERPMPLVDFAETGPIRCTRCRGYINPFVIFIDGGRKFVCNLCGFENAVPTEYFANLDMNGRRVDLERRPELQFGSVEFVATKEYCARQPEAASYIFLIDVTYNSVHCGMLQTAVSALKDFLYSNPESGLPFGCRVGIMTYDLSVHFYNLKSTLEQPQMLLVPDVSDVFVPLSEGLLVDPQESRVVIESLLDNLPTMFQNNRASQPMLGAAVQAAYLAMKQNGGKLSVFNTSLPTAGPGALKIREDPKLLGTDKEKTLYEPAEYFWRKLAQDCSQAGVCIDLYSFPNNAYVDIATVGTLSSLTGGDTFMYPAFEYNRDANKFGNDMKKTLSRYFGFDALLRVRCSNGLKITDHHGNFYMKNSTDVELAGMDSNKAIAITIKHDGKIDESRNPDAFFQIALLYTTPTGDRRIRVHNLAVAVTASMANVFRFADMDTTINYFAKMAVAQTVTSSLRQVREQLTEKCIKVLAAYRKHVASSSGPGQLILPEAYKLYPLYTLALTKHKAFKGGPEMSTDIRVYNLRMLRSMTVLESIPLLYPVMFGLHDMTPEAGTFNEYTGKIILPNSMRVSYERLDPAGIYILENGLQMFLWVGSQVSPELLRLLFDVESADKIDSKMRALPKLDNPLSERVSRILGQVQSSRPRYVQMQIVRHQIDSVLEMEFMNLLVEDKNNDAMSYMDFLVFSHKNIQLEITSSS